MKFLYYFFACIILFSYSSSLKSEDSKIYFGWKTSTGFLLKIFGDKNIHPQYEGEFKAEKPNGLGIMTFPSGKRYLGEWKLGKREGHGTITMPSGIKYVGEFKDDKMWNIIKYSEEGKYLGEFKNGFVWNGIVYDKNGTFLGRWINGIKQ